MRTSTFRSALVAALLTAASLSLITFPAAAQPAGASAGGAVRGADALASATAAFERGEFAAAERLLATIKSGPELAQAKLAQARIELRTGRYDKAVETARAASGLGKDAKIAAAPIRAEALAAQGRISEAIAVVREVESEETAHRARVVLGELLIRTGKRGEANAPLRALFEAYKDDKIKSNDAEGLTLVARAAHLLRSYKNANKIYNEAEKAGGNKRVETLLYRADLFLEKYDPGHAGQVVTEAAKIAPKDPLVHVALARVKLENAMDFAAAESEIRQALEINPNLSSAYFVRAGLALRDLDIAAADAAVNRGLSTNPSDLDLLSMKAAVRYLADDPAGFEAMKKRVFGINPEYSTLYQVVGEYAEWEHRYEDIVRMMREAVQLDPGDAKAYATLGLNLIRSGDDKAGLEALRKAWDKDPFNVRVYNTLNFYEKEVENDYVTLQGQRFILRYHKEEKDILERYVPRMLEEAWGSMVKRYGFTPKQPVSIELYADPQHFSIRTSGLPNVGIQGVCFGQTLAALSPSAGEFNWGNVLWHELGHVFAIQQSKNHVPRWFTEGLSEYETIIRRPEWQREEDPALFAAWKGGRIPAVGSFNRAFTHVDSVEDVTMAYFAASQIVVFMAKEFGFPKVVSMLPRWAAGERTPEVVKGSLGITTEELDRRFKGWLEPRLSRYTKQFVPDLHAPPLDDARKAALADPKNGKKLVELALALLEDGQEPEAEATLAEALRVDPKQPDAHYFKLLKAFRAKDAKEAGRLITKMIADGNDGYALRMKEADLAEVQKDLVKMKASLEAAARFDPSQAEPLQGLYDLAHKQKDKAGELSALRRLSLIDQHDRRVWVRLLRLLTERGEWQEAKKVGESAIFVDVANPEVHRLYAKALARTGNFISAVFELNSALIAMRGGKPKPDEVVAIYKDLETAYEKLKKDDLAKQAREYAKLVSPEGAKPEPEGGGLRGSGTKE
jgi:tetratricopeptide (TPR) repeat protein